jgi:hypothetical protein
LWHVDDLKISHVDPKVVSSIISALEGIFVLNAPLTKTRGKGHGYLGMTIDYSTPGKVLITMINYIDSILAGLPPEMDSNAPTLATSHLFMVNLMSEN